MKKNKAEFIRNTLTALFLIAAVIAAFCAGAMALSVDYDGDGIPDAVGSTGNVPMPPKPTPVYPQKSNTSNNSQKTYQQQPKAPAPKPKAPSSEQVAQQMMVQGLFQVLLNEVFAPPKGPSPEELQRIEAEKLRIEQEKLEKFLRSKEELSNSLKGVGGQSQNGVGTVEAGGLQLKMPPAENVHQNFFGTPVSKPDAELLREETVADNSSQTAASEGKVGLLREQTAAEKDFTQIRQQQERLDELRLKEKRTKREQEELEELTARRNNVWAKAVSNTDLTQEERERLQLKMHTQTGFSSDHPMIDSNALIAREQWTDPYLDVAAAAAKGGAASLGISATEEGGKMFLTKKMGKARGYDELLSAGKLAADPAQSTAQTTMAVIDYGLTKAPSWAMLVDGAANAVGSGTRQAIIRYRASKNTVDYRPIEEEEKNWDSWVMDRNEWVRTGLERVGMGRIK